MLWVDHGMAPADVLAAPAEVVDAAVRLIATRRNHQAAATGQAHEQNVRAELQQMLGVH